MTGRSPESRFGLATTVDQLIAREIGKSTQVGLARDVGWIFRRRASCDSGGLASISILFPGAMPTTAKSDGVASTRSVRALVRRWRKRQLRGKARIQGRGQHPRFGADAGSRPPLEHAGLGRPQQVERVSRIGPRNRGSVFKTRKRSNAQSIELTDRPTGIPDSFDEHTKLMFDLQLLAYRADITRVVQHDHVP